MSKIAGKKILIVDDEVDLADLLQEAFEGKKTQVVCCHDGKEGLEKAISWEPDLIISDARMPQMSGFKFLSEIRKLRLKSYFIMVSGYAEGLERKAHLYGVDALFHKPYRLQEVLSFAEKLLTQAARKRRTYARVACKLQIRTKFGETKEIDTFTHNLSDGGIFIELPSDPLPQNDEVIEFKILPFVHSKEAISGKGHCRWLRELKSEQGPRGFGIQFQNPSIELNQLVKRLIEETQIDDPEWI